MNCHIHLTTVKSVVCCLFSWRSLSEAIDDHLTKLANCHEKWMEYEKHKNEVTNRVADVEELARSFLATVFGTEAHHQLDTDSIQVYNVL